ncbi:hypothetical protein [Leuconostoc suionicum]|uniref:hypothetical protein n=1 Tax=Leuconostoc suionicum TaxID=1511761 RepID=UPI001B8B592B|nr:hypothetical protein [Leuconostoc suionicum]MBS1008510.1 hypothetical protein [Leuconostoc suionicum]
MIKIKTTLIFGILAVFLVLSTVVTPTDSLGIKKILLVLTILCGIIIDRSFFQNIKLIGSLAVAVLALIVFSLFNGSSFGASITVLYPIVYIFVGIISADIGIDFEKIFSRVVICLSLIITVTALLDMFHLLTIENNPVMNYISTTGEGQISTSSDAIFHYVIFLNGSPLILYNVAKFGFQRKYKLLLVSVLGLFFSGTRANIYMAIIILLIIIIFSLKNLLLSILVFLASLFGVEFLKYKNDSINQAKASGDMVRELKLESIKTELGNNFYNWNFGKGLGSYYYGPEQQVFNIVQYGYINTSEWSYMELIRQGGIFGLIIILVIIIKPLVTLLRHKVYYAVIGLVSYLIVATVDPFLITSTGFILYSVMYYLSKTIQFNQDNSK